MGEVVPAEARHPYKKVLNEDAHARRNKSNEPKRNMKISIIVPTYNQDQYIEECIESILGQTMSPHEVILVNDGSTDNIAEILRKFPSLKVIHQTNRGLSSARNTGIMNATGDWILPLDSDDKLRYNAIERLTQIASTSRADVIGISFETFGLMQAPVILMSDPTVEDFKTGNRIGYCSLIKKDVLLEVGGYSTRMDVGYEDYALWFDLLSRGKIIETIPEILWYYRRKPNSMIDEAQKPENHIRLMQRIAKDFPDIFPEPKIINTPLPE